MNLIRDKIPQKMYMRNGHLVTSPDAPLGQWYVQLWECPSQGFMGIEVKDCEETSHYLLYLRWRHKDPWKAYLLPCGPEYSLESMVENKGLDAYQLPILHWRENGLTNAQHDAWKAAFDHIQEKHRA